MKIPSLDFHKGKLSVKLAESAYDKEKNRKDKTTQHSSNIITSGELSLDSGKNITIAGSNLDAGGDISLSAKENINIIPVKETQKTISEKTDREITLSLEIGNAYLDAAYAVSDAARAAAAVEDARQELSRIKKLRDIGKATDEAVKDAEINLEMALLNLGFNGLRAANTTADIAGASSTSFGTGFYADMRLDTIETESESKENRITNIPSEITSQKNITFLTNRDKIRNCARVLERNINKRETITKDIITGALDFDAGIDLRLSSKTGREEIKEDFQNAGREIEIVYKTIEGNLFNEKATRDLISKLKKADKNYGLTAYETEILEQMELSAQQAGYDVKNMSINEKLAVFDKLSEKKELTTEDKIIRDIIWYHMGNRAEWTAMREVQQKEIISAFVKDDDFWRGKTYWNFWNDDNKHKELYLRRDVSDKMADILGMRRVRLKFYEDIEKKDTQGIYDPNIDTTKINKAADSYKNFYSTINVVSHETAGHGYQDFVIETKDKFLQENPNIENQVKIFEYSYDATMSPGSKIDYTDIYGNGMNYIIYRNDPGEIDAFDMGDTVEGGIKKDNQKKELEKELKNE